MGRIGAFKIIHRETPDERAVEERVRDYNEIYLEFAKEKLVDQASRCMNCGIPFCNNGCPLGNIIPEWNDLVSKDRLKEAVAMLHKTNNFPEFTGRICPAPCEESCTLNVEKTPVSIKLVELQIIERAFKEGWIKAEPPARRTGKKIAVVGSGPAGLACAAQLNKAGHIVTVFERADRVGGLLTYGIPGFKLDKEIVERRVRLLKEEGVEFVTKANVGFITSIENLRKNFDAIVLCNGATKARDLDLPGRDLKGIHYAVDFLTLQTKKLLGDKIEEEFVSAKDKHVIVLGGGDTGADCVGTSMRQGCKSVHQFELLPEPPKERTADMPWPLWPMIMRTSSSHEEALELQAGKVDESRAKIRDYAINTKSFSGKEGVINKLNAVRLEWSKAPDGRLSMKEIPGTEFEIECDLCLLALGFVHPEHKGVVEQLNLEKDQRGNIKVDENYMTSVPKVFAAGDSKRGQSLVVWAISEGRQAARAVDLFLMGRSDLPELKL